MKLSKNHWIVDLSLIALSVCFILPIYLLNRQYAQAAGSKALFEARTDAANYPEKYDSTLPAKTHDKPSLDTHGTREKQAIGMPPDVVPHPPNPDIYYRRKVTVGNWMLWLFLLPLLGGLTARRWVASAVIVILWLLTWHLQGLKY
jgi:hypothetical protein